MTETLPRHRSRAELDAALPHVLAAPREAGRLELIVVRPAKGLRTTPARARLTAAEGVVGDHWSKGCWKSLPDGSPDPNVQICLMMARAIEAIAGRREDWAEAGDNLFLDMDLTPESMPPGTQFRLGTARMVVTAEPHNGCQGFIDRYGRDACVWVNTGAGKLHRLRGIYARVLVDGEVAVGDRVERLG